MREKTVYYYEFHYFFSRRDGGSIFAGFDHELPEDEDERIDIAVKAGALDEEYADSIDYCQDLTEEEVCEICGEDVAIYEVGEILEAE